MSSGHYDLAAKLKTKRGYLTNQVSHLIKRPELLFMQANLSTKQVNNNKAGCCCSRQRVLQKQVYREILALEICVVN